MSTESHATLSFPWENTFVAAAHYMQTNGVTWVSKYGDEKTCWARVVSWGDEFDVLVSDGFRHNASAEGFNTQLDAQVFAEEVLTNLAMERVLDPVSRPFQELVNTIEREESSH